MFTLILTNGGENRPFDGDSKKRCLNKLRKYIESQAEKTIQLEIEKEYKDTRSLRYEVRDGNPVYVVDINENGCGEEKFFASQKEAVDRFLEICEEDGEHWTYEAPEVFVEGVKARKIEMQRHPPEDDAATEAASRVVKILDDAGYSREQVYAIACWVQYMATQR